MRYGNNMPMEWPQRSQRSDGDRTRHRLRMSTEQCGNVVNLQAEPDEFEDSSLDRFGRADVIKYSSRRG